MSEKTNDGGPAFPYQKTICLYDTQAGEAGPTITTDVPGAVTLRDYFAAAALTGFCHQATGSYDKGPCNAEMVERSYVLADAMLREREKPRDQEGEG